MGEYRAEAVEDAKEIAREFLEKIVENVMAHEGEISETEVTDYSDDHIQTLTDRSYKLKDAAELMIDLDEFEETDSGLWEGKDDPRQALKIMAAFTYGNAVSSLFTELMKEINEKIGAALGEVIFFDFEDWVAYKGKASGKGPFRWRPGISKEELERDEEAFNKQHMDETLDRVEKIIKGAIEAWT